MIVAAVDCEAIRDGLVAQPANATSSLAFVFAGIVLLRRSRRVGERRDLPVAAGLVSTGVGSVVFHGPMPGWGQLVHDVPIVWLLGALAWRAVVAARPAIAHAAVVATVGVAMVVALVEGTTALVTGALGIAVLAAEHEREPFGRGDMRLLAIWSVAALGWWAGREASSWCRPDTLLQPHAAWHVFAAAGVVSLLGRAEPAPGMRIRRRRPTP